jgi:tRNA modification GTPase
MLDTIIALATPPGRGGVAIIRLSGPKVKNIAQKILRKPLRPRYAMYTPFYDEAGLSIDEGLALYFPSPHSFTGEDVLELHCHGGPVLVDYLIKKILNCGEIRLARAGEFSERAFLNDKIDLAQAEAIADLINASSEQAVRASSRSLQGEFSNRINKLIETLIHLRTYIEAAIDFVEEEIDFLKNEEVYQQFEKIMQQLESVETAAAQGCLLREGITAVIVGEPNVGKSSLLNQLSGKETAIVTPIPGTTRDVLRDYVLLDGMPMHIIDTAGLRKSDDIVEQEGIRRAREEMKRADLLLIVTDANVNRNLPHDIHHSESSPLILIHNKIDLTKDLPSLRQEDGITIISLSAKTGDGIDLLKNHIKSIVGYQTTTEGNFSARRRHLDAITRAKDFLQKGFNQLRDNPAGELIAEDLSQAQKALSEITGKFTSDDLLGQIFSSFCIGK